MVQKKDTATKTNEKLLTEEYHVIESAVMETARGRWFLEEYARRNRVADTEMLLGAIAKLGNTQEVAQEHIQLDVNPKPNLDPYPQCSSVDQLSDQMHLEVSELYTAIQLTRQEIEASGSVHAEEGGYEPTVEEMEDIQEHSRQAISSILKAAEAMQASAWAAREEGTDADICDRLDKCAIEIYTACTLQELTEQRIARLISLVEFVESHTYKMLQHWQIEDVVPEPLEAIDPEPSPAEEREDDDRVADVFEVAAESDGDVPGSEERGVVTTCNEEPADGSIGEDDDPFEGQDTFESTAETLKGFVRSR